MSPRVCIADLLVTDAHIVSPGAPAANWLAVRDGHVLRLGTGEPACTAAQTLDLHGATVLPGFIDMHAHPAEGGRELKMLDLSRIATVDALATAVRAWATDHPRDRWVEGAGWDAAVLDGAAPLRALDAATTKPVFLSSSDGHSAFVNTAALRAAKLDPVADPPNGRIDRGPDGPTGWIRESATDLVAAAIPPWSADRTDEAVKAGLAEFARYGITTIVDANADADSLASYRRLDRAGALTARIFAAIEVDPGEGPSGVRRAIHLRARFHTPHLAVNAVKLYLDGVVESRTASLLAPYTDGTNAPLNFTDPELDQIARAADAAGLQIHAHAIGDAAVRQFLDAVERLGHRPVFPPLAAHIELIDPADVLRFAPLGVVADVQALWAYPDRFVQSLTVPVVGPERAERLYPFGSLRRANATIVAGSDWSVTTMNPWPAIEVAATRRDPDDATGPVLGTGQELDVDTMIAAYTSTAASALATHEPLGTLAPGAWADFVVLDRDPATIPVAELSEVGVAETWLAGRKVYDPHPGR